MKLTGTNVILVAPMGAGKSTAMDEVGKKLGDECIAMVGFRTIADLYNFLWDKILKNEKETIEPLFGKLHEVYSWFKRDYCSYPLCPRKKMRAMCKLQSDGYESSERDYDKRLHQEVPVIAREFDEICEELSSKKESCPMKRHIVNGILGCEGLDSFNGKVFLLDIVDDFTNYKRDFDIFPIDELIKNFQVLGKLIVTATHKQYKRMEKSQAISRINVMDFPLMTKEELIEISRERAKMGDIPPFTDEVVNVIVSSSHFVVREMLHNCSRVLHADGKPVKEVLDVKSGIGETDAIGMLVKRLMEEKRGWLRLPVLIKILKKDYGRKIGVRSLGRRLTDDWGMTIEKGLKRKNDGVEYWFD